MQNCKAMKEIHLNTADLERCVKDLNAGDKVILSGTVYTARDAAHKRFFDLLDNGSPLPFEIKGSAIYYAGPTPTPEGLAVGSCGPTTSSRMDVFTPRLLDLGLKCMIGKGERNEDVCRSIKDNGAVYLCAIGGAGALACEHISECEVIAFEDLGCESVKRLTFNSFPLICAIDSHGGNLFNQKRNA